MQFCGLEFIEVLSCHRPMTWIPFSANQDININFRVRSKSIDSSYPSLSLQSWKQHCQFLVVGQRLLLGGSFITIL